METIEHRDENGETAEEQWRRLSAERGAILRRYLTDGHTIAELADLFRWCRAHRAMAWRVYEHRRTFDPVRIRLTEDEARAWRARSAYRR